MINDKGYLNGDLLNGADIQQTLLNNHNLMLKQVPNTGKSYIVIGDYGSASYQLEKNKIYLYLNSHPSDKQVYLINGYDGGWVEIVTQKANSVQFTYTSSNIQLTIKALSNCRGYLFELVNILGT